MPYSIRTLGRAGIAGPGGDPVDFPLGKPFGMLVYLVVTGGPVTREELAELFWADSDHSRARQSVRQALSFLRKRLGPELFITDDPVEVDAERVTSDVARVESAVASGEPVRVLEAYRGPFLSTVQLASSRAWDHWVEMRRRVLAERVASSLRAAAAATSDASRAVEWLERAVEIEPHRAVHRVALIERLLERGELELATAALAEGRQSEADRPELLEEASERIEGYRRAREPVPEEALTPEFVGRSEELSSLVAAWKRARSGRRELALVSGPTGIGKTRLTEELASLVVADGGRVAQVKASASERRLEWGVTAELIRALYGMPGAAGISGATEAVLRSLVPSLGAPTAAHAPASAPPVAISDALADLIEAVAYEAPLLVVLDDMQWVDRSSVALLQRSARQIRNEPVLVAFTFRTEEVSAGGLESAEALIREEAALSLRLAPLDASEVEELLTLSGLEEDPDRLSRLAERLHAVSHGHPLFLVELLRTLQDEGVLVRVDEQWRLEGPTPEALELPASVRSVIERRVEQLSPDARRVGQELASLPPGSRLERVRVRSGLSDSAFTAGLNELLARDVIRWDSAGRPTFSHDQLREAMTPAAPRRRLVAAVAAALAVLALATAWGLLRPAPVAPYGGGTLLVWPHSDSMIAFRVDDPLPREWTRLAQPPFWVPEFIPEHYGANSPRRLTDGTVLWYGRVQTRREAPDAVVYPAGEPPDIVIDRPGDDEILAVSPDGTRMVSLTERLSTPGYDLEFRIGSLGGGLGELIAGPSAGGSARWSDDGRRIALALVQARDSLLILSPTGERVAGFTAFAYRTLGWCGGSRRLLVDVQDVPTEGVTRLLLDVETGERRVVERSPAGWAACSPDGSAVLGSRVERGREIWYLQDLATGEERSLTGVTPQDLYYVQWVPDSLPPVPERLVLDRDTLRLAHGDRAILSATLLLSDGSRRGAPDVSWQSTNEGIASVLSGSQTLSANRIGRARLVATYDHWLRDTLPVEVRGGDQPALLLAEEFEGVDTTRWLAVGEPTVAPVRVDGKPALELLGDGRYRDGIVSRPTYRFGRGATLEADIRFPLTANQLQKIELCLRQMDPPADPELRGLYSVWDVGADLCFAYPAFELEKWSPELFRFHTENLRSGATRFPVDVDAADWIRVGIQVLPNGDGSLWLNGRKVAEQAAPPDLLNEPVRVTVLGATVGTRGFVRGLRLWAEPRYR